MQIEEQYKHSYYTAIIDTSSFMMYSLYHENIKEKTFTDLY